MKKLLLLMFTTIIIVGCETESNYKVTKSPKVNEVGLSVIEYDSCEYVKGGGGIGNSSYLAHKGNCKYCKERRKKEFYEMIDVLFNMQE